MATDGSGIRVLRMKSSLAVVLVGAFLGWICGCASGGRGSSAPPGSWLAVLDKSDATLRVIEPNSGHVRDVLPTGRGPHECAASPDGELLVVCNYGDQTPGSTLSVYDLRERRLRDTIDLAPHQRPHGIAFVSARRVLVTSETSKAVLEVDLTRNRVVRALDTGAETSHMLALTPDGKRVFTANIRSNSVSAIDLESGKLVGTIETGKQPEAIDVTPDGQEVWIGHNGDQKLVVLDARSLEKLAEIPCAKLPIRLACTRDGKLVLVSCALSGEVALIDRAARREIARIALPARAQPAEGGLPPDVDPRTPVPVGLRIETKDRYAYVALNAADQVAVIDIAARRVVRTFDTGRQPDGMSWIFRREPAALLGGRDALTP